MTRFLLIIAALLTSAQIPAVRAQQPPCPYDECALRLKGASLVQGRQEFKVARFTFTARRLDSLMQRSDSAARYYALFRTRYNRGFWLSIAGVGLFGAGALVQAIEPNRLDGLKIGLLSAGTLGIIVGTINQARSREPLSKAVWWYNRSLDPSRP